MRRLFDTNFWGLVNGSLVAIPHLGAAGGGALVNMGSVLSDRAAPVQGICSASKHAVQGFTDALRDELGHRRSPIAVTLIKQWSAATPITEHVRNYTGHKPKLPQPLIDPHRVAAAVLQAAERPTRAAFVGMAAPLTAAWANIAPGLLDRFSQTVLFEAQLGPETAPRPDNLTHGLAEARIRSRTGEPEGRISNSSDSQHSPTLSEAMTASVATSLVLLALRRR